MEKNALKKEIQQLEERLLQPEVRSNPEELKQFLIDDFFEFGSSGVVWHKKDRTGEKGIEEGAFSLFDFAIFPLAEDAVLATYRAKDETSKKETLRSSVWKQTDGSWQLFFHQGTVTEGKQGEKFYPSLPY